MSTFISKYSGFAILLFFPLWAGACTLSSDIGAPFEDIVARSSDVDLVQIENTISILDKKKKVIQITTATVTKSLKGVPYSKIKIISDLGDVPGSYFTSWYGCIPVYQYKIGDKYLMSPNFSFYRNYMKNVRDDQTAIDIFKMFSKHKISIPLREEILPNVSAEETKLIELIKKCKSDKKCTSKDVANIFNGGLFHTLLLQSSQAPLLKLFGELIKLPQITDIIAHDTDKLVSTTLMVISISHKNDLNIKKPTADVLQSWLKDNDLTIRDGDIVKAQFFTD